MDSPQSLALALTYVAQELAISVDRELLQQTASNLTDLPGAVIAEKGVYGTYPAGSPCVVTFDNGLFYYVKDAADRKIINTDYTVVDMQLFGTPVAWARYTLPKPAPMIYVDCEVDGIHYRRLGAAPQKMYVIKPEGVTKKDFSNQATTFRDFIGVPGTDKAYGEMVRVMGTADYPIIPTGQRFYIDMDDWGEFTRTGKVKQLHGYFEGDLVDTVPPPLAPKRSTPPVVIDIARPTVTPVQPAVAYLNSKPENMGFRWLNDEHSAVRYQVMRPVPAMNYLLPRSRWAGTRVVLHKPKIVAAYGTFPIDNRMMFLLKIEDAGVFDYWYGIPEFDSQGNRLIEEVPDMSELRTVAAEVQQERSEIKHGAISHLVSLGSSLEIYLKHRIFKVKR